ncbi:hypothetical protein B0H16DRAFT_362099 [Mycena metata]|uniref:Uncharacterized protein n=1 Tax=Mycena metata TaxID=1033252 RepID=A0AAD7HK67_9AGAR|nr:hypothetical protein B0H16DRAFT_362099 [Mycena metata]
MRGVDASTRRTETADKEYFADRSVRVVFEFVEELARRRRDRCGGRKQEDGPCDPGHRHDLSFHHRLDLDSMPTRCCRPFNVAQDCRSWSWGRVRSSARARGTLRPSQQESRYYFHLLRPHSLHADDEDDRWLDVDAHDSTPSDKDAVAGRATLKTARVRRLGWYRAPPESECKWRRVDLVRPCALIPPSRLLPSLLLEPTLVSTVSLTTYPSASPRMPRCVCPTIRGCACTAAASFIIHFLLLLSSRVRRGGEDGYGGDRRAVVNVALGFTRRCYCARAEGASG